MTRLSNTDDFIEVGDDSLVSQQEEILAPVAALILTVSGIWAEDFPSQEPLAVDPVLHRQWREGEEGTVAVGRSVELRKRPCVVTLEVSSALACSAGPLIGLGFTSVN